MELELIGIARGLVEQRGVEGLTLRAAAKAAEVSHNAPYLYFPDGLTELHAAVALEGFEDLTTTINSEPRALAPEVRVHEVVLRYVRFGVENPSLYRAMFHERLADALNEVSRSLTTDRDRPRFKELNQVKSKAYDAIVEPLKALKRCGTLRGRPDHFGLAVAALAHGLVGEFIDEGLGGEGVREGPWSPLRARMTSEVTDMLLYGLLAPQATT